VAKVIHNHPTFEDHNRCLFEVNDDVGDGDESKYVDDDKDDFIEDDFDDDETLKDDKLKRRARLMSRSVIETIHGNAVTATTADIAGIQFSPTPLPPYIPYTPFRVNMSIRSFKHQV